MEQSGTRSEVEQGKRSFQQLNTDPPPPYPGNLSWPNVSTRGDTLTDENTCNDNFQTYSEDVGERNVFLRKVFGLLTLHGGVILGVIALFMYVPVIRSEIFWEDWVTIVILVTTIISLLLIGSTRYLSQHGFEPAWKCRPNLGPTILQGLVPLFLAFPIAAGAINTDSDFILIVMATITATIFVSFLFTLQTRWDFAGGVIAIICILPMFAYVTYYFATAPAKRNDGFNGDEWVEEDRQKLLVAAFVISALFYVAILVMAYIMGHQHPGSSSETVCGINLYRKYDEWAISVMQVYFGLMVALLIIALSVIIIAAALRGRFICCWVVRTERRRNEDIV